MLRTVVADRPEDLLDELVTALRGPLDDSSVASLFTPEWVSVPSLGMATWLRGRLARRLGAGADHDGISANVEYPFPGVLRWAILDAHRLAADPTSELADPWRVDRLVWSVLEVLSDPPDDLDERLTRRGAGVSLAGRAGPLADLFDQYVVHRPQMVLDWLDGNDVGADGTPIDATRAWQPALFRAVQRHIAARHGVVATPAERLTEALDQLRAGRLDLGPGAPRPVPPRLFVAGQSLITAELGPVLSSLALQRDVTLLLLSPSARTTVEVAERTAAQQPTMASRAASWAIERSSQPPMPSTAHPLLVTWAQRPLESAALLGAGGAEVERAEATVTEPATLLQRLQRDLQDGAVDAEPFAVTESDHSVQLHGAPGRTRQVEVLRDTILGLLRDDPTLTEADVVVLCPALDEFAPVLTAALGPPARRGEQPAADTVPALRYAVVDRSARSFNPVLDGLAALLELLPGRFDATAVRGFLALPAVRERFGLSTEDLALAEDWTDETRVRWGLDAAHRQRWDVEGAAGNSWQAALDGLLMGVALGDDLRDAALPGVGSPPDPTAEFALAPGAVAPMSLADGDLAAAGRLAAALGGLAAAHQRLVATGARTVSDWVGDLDATLDDLFAVPRFEDWQRTAVDELLAGLRSASATVRSDPPEASSVQLELSDVRRLLAPSLEGARARADLGYGSIVVARPSLVQSVPYRVVCVLGLDGDALPAGRALGDDLLRHAPMVGDRDTRAEARAELLAAITAARDSLVVTFSSTDVRTNSKVPEAVALDELVEVIAATLGTTPGELRDPDHRPRVIRRHPRQAFDPANFGGGPHPEPIGFDPVALEGARSLQQPHDQRPDDDTTLLAAPLAEPTSEATSIELADLRSFFRHPVRTFFRTRLDVVVPTADEAPDDELPVALARLDRSWIGSQLVRIGVASSGLDGLTDGPAGWSPDVRAVLDSARARGLLPPEPLVADQLDEICDEVALLLAEAARHGVCRPSTDTVPIDIALPSGVRLVGTATDCVDGDRPGPVDVRYSRPKPHRRLQLAIDLLAGTVADPTLDRRAVLITRGESRAKDLQPIALAWQVRGDGPAERRTNALDALDQLVAIRADGLRIPLPLFDATSFALAEGTGEKAAWGSTSGRNAWVEAMDPYHQLAFGPLELTDLLRLDVDGRSAQGEADRLWGVVDAALVADADDDTSDQDDTGAVGAVR